MRGPIGLGVLVLGTACAAPRLVTQPAPALARAEIETSLLLIGDAGSPSARGEPVLAALEHEARRDTANTVIVYLGDNIYPRGLPDSTTPAPLRREAERRLQEQIDVGRRAGVRTIFVPGNHDWAKSGADGWNAIRRQERYIADNGAALAELLPRGGCPGPVTVDVGAHVRLIAIDTQWWLQRHAKPMDAASGCATFSESQVVAALEQTLRDGRTRHAIVMGHHPLVSAGPHGGHFSVLDHLFPLREVARWLWIPLPIIGSLYPLARQSGISAQDISSRTNRRMREALEHAFAEHPPLVYADGHEHNLQVLDGRSARHLIVSGAGIVGHEGGVGWRRDTRYATDAAGFVRLDFLRDDRVRLGVVVVGGSGVREAFSMWLE